MLSQLNYKAAAYLNGGGAPTRQPLGAHNFYVPAQLFETASGYLALFVTRDEAWRRLCVAIDRTEWADDPRFATMHARFEHRAELLDALAARLKEATGGGVGGATASARDPGGRRAGARRRARRRARAFPRHGRVDRDRRRAASRHRQPDPIRRRRAPEYRAPPRLHEHTDELLARPAARARSGVVVDDDLAAGGNRLAGQDPAVVDLLGRQARC